MRFSVYKWMLFEWMSTSDHDQQNSIEAKRNFPYGKTAWKGFGQTGLIWVIMILHITVVSFHCYIYFFRGCIWMSCFILFYFISIKKAYVSHDKVKFYWFQWNYSTYGYLAECLSILNFIFLFPQFHHLSFFIPLFPIILIDKIFCFVLF